MSFNLMKLGPFMEWLFIIGSSFLQTDLCRQILLIACSAHCIILSFIDYTTGIQASYS